MTADSQIPGFADERVDLSPFPDKVVVEPAKGILDRLWTAMLSRVPLGYQDETGFHYGANQHRAGVE